MLTDVVRNCLDKVSNRFELVVLVAERTRQLIEGARPTLDNPSRERYGKLAMRELVQGKLVREPDGWRVDRPGLSDLFDDSPKPAKAAKAEEAAAEAGSEDGASAEAASEKASPAASEDASPAASEDPSPAASEDPSPAASEEE